MIATDAPLLPNQCARVAQRAGLVGRDGLVAHALDPDRLAEILSL
ncbi:MAG: hypothetical protein ACRDGU_03560 [Actinomycetota bacterium]